MSDAQFEWKPMDLSGLPAWVRERLEKAKREMSDEESAAIDAAIRKIYSEPTCKAKDGLASLIAEHPGKPER